MMITPASSCSSTNVADVFQQIVLKDLTQCDEAALHKLLEEAATPRLERMELGMAGRGFGPKVKAQPLGPSWVKHLHARRSPRHLSSSCCCQVI